MAITLKEVGHIAKLARIELTPEELSCYTSQLDKILEYINKLRELDVKGVEPTTGVLPLKNVLREDQIKPSLSIETVVKMAPDKKNNQFKVPKIIECEMLFEKNE
ncbi:MAG: Asp-tRNA(Asn)/Glu-tRNA(Gln) amidotransferase subunit GatC [Candidatus Omnitrophica bacterium]|nr:Asp-tRNA(Asn)/Glu-tRNA(Gln) amidotransferase subunit GatC [Candidatus Omnitrophota bacterium]